MDYVLDKATIKHLNIRKQGPEDAKEIALDIKVCGVTANRILPRLLGADDTEDWVGAFWTADGDAR